MKSRRGVTLLELVVTVGIMLSLITVGATFLSRMRGHARLTECRNNMRQVWTALSGYAQDHYDLLPAGEKGEGPEKLPASTARLLDDLLDGHIEQLYCRTHPLRSERLEAWQKARSAENERYRPYIGYLYLAGSRFENWDVPNEQLPDEFGSNIRITDVGQGLAYNADVVWMADVALCENGNVSDRLKPYNWKRTSHPSQVVVREAEQWARVDYQLPDGANVLFEGGHVLFRPFGQLRPRLMKSGNVYYW